MDNNENKSLDRISYALGLSMGNNFRASGITKSTFRTLPTAWLPCSTAPHPR